jgi:5-methyltetrahydrofolate corrinoid/iron sulfur protein methyltransferase
MAKVTIIGERIHMISPEIKDALATRNEEPLIRRAKEQLDAGADWIDVNIGPAEKDGVAIMKWAVETLQGALDNVPLVLDTVNVAAIEAGISVYNRAKSKPIINSADAGERLDNIRLAGANDAIAIALLMKKGVPANNDERNEFLQEMLEVGMEAGLDVYEDLWFDPLMLVIKGMQEKQPEFFDFLRTLTEMGLKSTCGLSNGSNGMPEEIRPKVDAVFCAMAIESGLTSVIANPLDKLLSETIKTSEIILDKVLYADSFLEL